MKKEKTKDLTPQDIADFFLSKKALSPKKVQKLVYYAYAWYITLYNEDPDNIEQVLFQEEPEAWMHGPVFPSLYQKYKEYGWREIPKKSLFQRPEIDSDSLKSFLNDVWNKYGKFSADELEFMTHQEEPWKKARTDTASSASSKVKISKRDIFTFYNGQIRNQ